MLRLITSRWTEAAWVVLLIAAAYTHSRALWIAAVVVMGIIIGALFVRMFAPRGKADETAPKTTDAESYAGYGQDNRAANEPNDKIEQ